MAMGIDAAAHRGALAAGGQTVAVLASGPEIASPAREAPLHRDLAARALVISELPPGTRPWRWAFPARNRIIAALAGMTVIVEAAERSGSLITAEIASDLGRDVGAVPGNPLSWRASGANSLLRDGARVVRGASDVIEDLIGLAEGGDMMTGRPPAPPPGLAPTLAVLLDAIEAGTDTIAALAGGSRPVGAVLAGLSELELLGHVRRDLAGRYVRVRP
jgi:DNA processing protein